MRKVIPEPRFRIYTKLYSYMTFIRDIAFMRMNKGNDIDVLEKKICEKFETGNAVCMPMARVGIHLAVKSVIKPGQKVILSSYNLADVINMVLCAKGEPLFADIVSATCNIDPDEVESLVEENGNIGAVIVTHLHGVAAPVFKINEICKKHGIPVIEDAAQAVGGKLNGKRLGTIGDIGLISFGMYKNITSWVGGVVFTDNDEIAKKIREEIDK